MNAVRQYGWLVPVIACGAIAIATTISPWLLGAVAAAAILLLHLAVRIIEVRRGPHRERS